MSRTETPETLDPEDWAALRALAHRMLDAAIDDVQQVRERPVWRAAPESVRAQFRAPLPRAAQGAAGAYADFCAWVRPYPMGNTHPRFWAWYMGNGTIGGALGDFLATVMNPNMGGGNHVANDVEAQVIDWLKQIVGLPPTASGLLLSGGSMANFTALAVARQVGAGIDVRAEGLGALRAPLRFYASTEVHSCVQKALELLGLGATALRRIGVNARYQIDLAALAEAIAADRAAGLRPCAVIGNAGTINTGAVDDLSALAALCAREALWFHVDGAIGGLLALAPRHAHLVAGIERADSVAVDLHKWMHAPFEAGCVLVRDAAAHRATFALTPAYLAHAPRGLAGGADWFSDYGLQLSRGFRALKLWLMLKEHGADKFGRLMDQNIAQAEALGARISATADLELMAPVALNIVCFRYRPAALPEAALNGLNEALLIRLHESGIAAPSYTTLSDRYCLRAAIVNHRTVDADLDILLEAVRRFGAELVAPGTAPRRGSA